MSGRLTKPLYVVMEEHPEGRFPLDSGKWFLQRNDALGYAVNCAGDSNVLEITNGEFDMILSKEGADG